MHISTILFDLDNTLYPASTGLMQQLTARITEYVQHLLDLEAEAAFETCRRYFLEHGTTLRGLQCYHQVDAEEFFACTHDLSLDTCLCRDSNLEYLLGKLNATKVVFSNAPLEHIQRVLRQLAIDHHFDQLFDIRALAFQPKPDPTGYRRVLEALQIEGNQVIMVEDTPQNLVTAREFGMTTILVAEQPDQASTAAADYIVPNIYSALSVLLDLQAAASLPAFPSCWLPPPLERYGRLAIPMPR